VAIALFLLFPSLRQIAEFWTDYLWFDSLDLSAVWTKTLLIKVQLGALFTAGFFVILWVNLFIDDRISPKFRPLGPDEDLLNRYHQIIDRRAGIARIVVAGIFAFITGAGMSSQWNEWVLFTNGGDFTTSDPIFGENVGFYVFRLPFLLNLTDWLFAALVIVLLITAVAHYLNGGIRLQSPFERVTPQVKAHLSVLLALLALVKAADYWLQRYELMFSQRGFVNGMTYTEEHAQLPAIYLLLFIALAAFMLFILNIRRRGWVLPVVAVGMWALVQLVMGAAYPAFFQRFIVEPEQSSKEAAAIVNNIDATQASNGIDDVDQVDFEYSISDQDAARAVTNNRDTTRNIQLLDPRRVTDTFQKLQSETAPYQFATLDTDRYSNMTVEGGRESPTQVVLANREINSATIPTPTWEGLHLSYTRGYGLALAAGGAVTQPAGGPQFAVRDVNPMNTDGMVDLVVDGPEVYYGELVPDYSVVGTTQQELVPAGTEDGAEPVSEPGYEGSGGVLLDSLPRRLAFGLRFGDTNLVISNFITDRSRILFQRNVRERAVAVAPFLTFDSNPYPAVIDDRMVYILDAYTTSDSYPNSQYYPGSSTGTGELRATRPFNYVRNSVKAVIDTYDGTVTLYVVDPSDPVIAAYQSAFPELFTPSAEMSQDLVSHLRYPEDLFRVQTDMWGRYHIENSKDFYDRTDAWEPPPAPPEAPLTDGATTAQVAIQVPAGPGGSTTGVTTKPARMAPSYVINKLPDEEDTSFKIMRTYQPYSDNDSKQLLTAFMAGGSDGDKLGKLTLYTPKPAAGSEGAQLDGPGIVSATILNDQNVSRQISLLDTQGSKVTFGELLLVPVDKSILYVRSFYVSVAGNQRVPQVKGVIVVFNGNTVLWPTLKDALKALFPTSDPLTLEGAVDQSLPAPPSIVEDGTGTTTTTTPSTTPGGTGTTVPPTSGDVPALIREANRLLAEADDLLKSGDLGGYQDKVEEASEKLRRVEALQSGQPPDPTVTSTEPSSTTTSSSAPPDTTTDSSSP
jgi:uncharacterized membrane protein (UPF0182 family)